MPYLYHQWNLRPSFPNSMLKTTTASATLRSYNSLVTSHDMTASSQQRVGTANLSYTKIRKKII